MNCLGGTACWVTTKGGSGAGGNPGTNSRRLAHEGTSARAHVFPSRETVFCVSDNCCDDGNNAPDRVQTTSFSEGVAVARKVVPFE